jgi:glutamate-1-semialdehyde 2,1-aminomutase
VNLFQAVLNSPVRAFGGVGGVPCVMKSSRGAYLYDDAGKSYIDFVCPGGPWILGHNPEEVLEALRDQLTRGMSSAPVQRRSGTCRLILKMIPGMDMIRLVNSGTEANE